MKFVTVIVHYNNASECSEIVNVLSKKITEHPIIIVDNNSVTANLLQLKRYIRHNNIEIIEQKENNGFGAGINFGVQYAQKYNPEFLHIVNTDVKLINPDYINQLITVLGEDNSLALAGPTIYKNEKKDIQNTIMPFPSLTNAIFFKKYAKQSYSSENIEVTEVDAINGVCFVIRNGHFKEISGFTESYFMYGEEQDMAFKLHKKGYKCIYVTIPSIIHFGADLPCNKTIDWKFIAVRANQIRFISFYRSKIEALTLSFFFTLTIVQKLITGYRFKEQSLRKIISIFNKTVWHPDKIIKF